MCLGYPSERTEVKPRLPLELVLKEDTYSTEGDEENLKEYDAIISDYYNKRSKGKRISTWTEGITALLREKQRPHMKEFLKNRGFELK